MNTRISFRNFLVLLAVLPSSISAFNPSNKPNLPPTSDVSEGLKAATVDTTNEDVDAWSSLTQIIQSKIDEKGGDSLSEAAKDEIIKTAVAGSILGTIVGSPLVVGAALGYAGSHMMQGENGEKAKHVMSDASKEVMERANSAIVFAKQELESEKDLSGVSAKILLAIQDKAGEIQSEVKESPALMAEKMKQMMVENMTEKLKQNVMKSVESQDFKTLPTRSFGAFKAFLESDEVKNVSAGALNAIKAGLESEEIKALQDRASKAVKDIDSKV
mmetsp:Transcript_4881/g.10775  ORF Transcript_4881/g.10775 Transcript_4881/m.10775 type:complete len:273 (-) Transcript_4881:238-1056(-)|eukprot:CAMPEP_0168182844 /NCGR_PEP_ID=MMETSP0139_2-20121125/12108_1 /TAXON_ID=44445 /ORGANISM="Pseudo-nitzschia australis, Strain 10249 10 AB" /LENGTH=272 /DNA_ID=CAMNT_0008103797 /DNA_START=71 /DNA_END=889 /DNA_ORIENTATION=-